MKLALCQMSMSPNYLVRLLEYYIRIGQITKEKVDAKPDSNLESSMQEHFWEDE